MVEKPILFNAKMVNAILEGRKTQTRRVVKPMAGEQKSWLTPSLINKVPHGYLTRGVSIYGWQMHHPKAGQFYNGVQIEKDSPLGWIKCPYGKIGDQLWIREIFRLDGTPTYKADTDDMYSRELKAQGLKWKPSIFMPRWASRIDLKITDIRVERLNDISEDDAKAEGVYQVGVETGGLDVNGNAIEIGSYAASFCELWDSINGKDKHKSWEANPWVWVIEFERIKP